MIVQIGMVLGISGETQQDEQNHLNTKFIGCELPRRCKFNGPHPKECAGRQQRRHVLPTQDLENIIGTATHRYRTTTPATICIGGSIVDSK